MAKKNAVHLTPSGDAQQADEDPTFAIPAPVKKALTEGGVPPFRIYQERGIYWLLLREPVKGKVPLKPTQRLRVWQKGTKVSTMSEPKTIVSTPGFDRANQRALVSCDPRNLIEVDLKTGASRELKVRGEAVEGKLLKDPRYLSDGRVLAYSVADRKTTLHVLTRDDSTLTHAYAAPIRGSYLLLDGSLLLGGEETIWGKKVGPKGLEPTFEIDAPDGEFAQAFDGRLFYHTDEGCFQVEGLPLAG